MITGKNPLFTLGQVVATPGGIKALEDAKLSAWDLLSRHCNGDFGDLDAEDRQSNLDAIQHGDRILSAYPLNTGDRVWVITEADRSSTCILRPDEY
jgi:hypothetical protein